ncbi:mediator of RNA polymerase II transcription subunit 25-like [Vicia villosa]|uniref:mediator of RNA polymerase II transcription subunit 25-like n=1 Tax=Vicia villosa TaxID=3911 RepID=UPI00273B1C85|nr:mediator of RNA polymerase II transcription subunit 25-like [Vicia villosa]
MENKRWLNIVVDGNKAMEQYWMHIVSNYLEKIVRCFVGERQDHENYLGLVFYNANAELVEIGYDMQFINWTKDVNKFMENLSHLSFNGNDINQSSITEGLAEALVMYPKPCDTMTEREYYNAERHCILVATGDPVPKTMHVCVPMILRAQVIGQRLQACHVDFLEVAKKCVPLAVSLSVITPNPVPIFGAIFNLGNNVLTLSNAPISSYSTGQLTILLSKNFREAHTALKEKRIVEFPSTSVASINIASDSTLLEESVASQATIGAKISEACNDLSTSQPFDFEELIFPNGTDQANVAFLNSQVHTNLYEDIMAELNSDNDIFPPMKRPRTFSPLEEDNDLINLLEKQISTEALIEVENELQKALNTSDDQTSNVEFTACSSKVVNFTPFEVQTPVSNTGEGSSTGLFSENSLQSWYNPHVITTNSSTLDSSSQFQASLSNGNFAYPNLIGNSQMQPQPYSSSTSQFPMFPSFARESIGNFPTQPTGQCFQAYNQYPVNNMTPVNLSPPLGTNYRIHSAQSISPSYPNLNSNSNLNFFSPLDDLQDYIHTWEVSKLFSFF